MLRDPINYEYCVTAALITGSNNTEIIFTVNLRLDLEMCLGPLPKPVKSILITSQEYVLKHFCKLPFRTLQPLFMCMVRQLFLRLHLFNHQKKHYGTAEP